MLHLLLVSVGGIGLEDESLMNGNGRGGFGRPMQLQADKAGKSSQDLREIEMHGSVLMRMPAAYYEGYNC